MQSASYKPVSRTCGTHTEWSADSECRAVFLHPLEVQVPDILLIRELVNIACDCLRPSASTRVLAALIWTVIIT